MALPPIRVDLMVDGAWSDITADVRPAEGVTISRGRADEARQVDPSTCQLTTKNRDGRYSPRNPRSPLYGKIGRNTKLRAGLGSPPIGAATPDLSGSSFAAPSVTAEAAGTLFGVWGASLDGAFTGPAGFAMGTIRVSDFTSWNGGTKAVSAGATGTSTATYSIVADHAVALSVVVPGVSAFAGFSTDDSGPVNVSVTGITGGDYLLAVQGWSSDVGDDMTVTPALAGQPAADWTLLADSGASAYLRIRAWICRLPADAASTETVRFAGAASIGVDNYGRVWRLTTATGYVPRHVGEVSAWPQSWDGADATTTITSSGILRRLGQGAAPLRSALTRHIVHSRDVVAYWPLEDPTISFASPIAGVAPGEVVGTPELSADDGFLGSDPLPTWQAAGFIGTVPQYAATGELFMGALFALPAAGTANGANLLSVGLSGGTLSRIVVEYRTTGDLAVKFLDKANAAVLDTSVNFNFDGDRFYAWLAADQNGTEIGWALNAIELPDGVYNPVAAQQTGVLAAQTLGVARSVTAGIEASNNGPLSLTTPVTIGHITIASRAQAVFRSDYAYYYPALVGWFAEGAVDRIVRLCREESIDVAGPWSTLSTALGPQRSGALVDLLQEAATADGGILFEPRGFPGLAYRSRPALENQTADLTLDYAAGQVFAPFEPTDDDQGTRNDVTVTRIGGASARAVLEEGPLSVQAPPDGVGRYDEAVDLSLWRDSQAADAAGWRLHLGTWDEARYPQVAVKLHAVPSLVVAAAAMDCGDRLDVTNLPTFLPPGPVEAIVQGYSETLDGIEWTLTFNASPAGPYRVAELDSADFGRLDSDDSTLATSATSGATALSVAVVDGAPLWITITTHPTEFPFDAITGGEALTVTAITGPVEDVFARTVANGWGSADTGGAWTSTGGSAANYAVGSGYASVVVPDNSVRTMALAAPSADVDIYADLAVSQTATGAALNGHVVARHADASNYYAAHLIFATSGALTVTVDKRVAGVLTALGTFNPGITYAPATFYRVRFQIAGTTLRAKIWPTARPEPPGWHITVTDAALAAAANLGLRSNRDVGNTNVNAEVRLDSYRIAGSPQTFTVTRAVNGITKAQAAGERISLRHPVYVPQGEDA